ncbi:MAG TPA: type II toxin-antitoxin system RelE/ParE family toxin [Sphingomonadaceae bacterium]
MELIFRERALCDLEDIETYYLREAPEALPKVLGDIRQVLNQLENFPRSGRAIGRRNARRALSPRYRYIVSYHVTRNAIEIVGIFRFQNRDA